MTVAPKTIWFSFMGASLAILAVAHGFEVLGELGLCTLCFYQRIPYWLVAGLAFGALFFNGSPKANFSICLVFTLIFASGAALSFYHVSVEQGWLVILEACGNVKTSPSIDALRESLATARIVRCDEVAWSFFGISLAVFYLLASCFLMALAIVAANTLRKGPMS